MPRRYYVFTNFETFKDWADLNKFISISAFLGFSAQLIFLYNFFNSIFNGERSTRNPWHSNTLEWTSPAIGIHGNWPGEIPAVYRWPYDYSRPDIDLDWLPQTMSDEDIAAKVNYASENYDPTATDLPESTHNLKANEEIVMLQIIQQKKK